MTNPAYGAAQVQNVTLPIASVVEVVGKTPDDSAWILRQNDRYFLYDVTAPTVTPPDCNLAAWGPPTPNFVPLNEIMTEVGIDAWHEVGYYGAGVRVGVLDTRYDGLDQLIASSPLSLDQFTFVEPLEDLLSILPGAEATDPFHGTNLIEVLIAIAPQADYVIARSVDAESFQDAVEQFIAANVDIIVHAGNVITADPTPYHTAVHRAVNEHDILWVNSAGNIGAGYFPGRFTGGGVLGSPLHSFQDPNVIGDARNTLLVSVSRERDIQVTLQWDDSDASFTLITLGSCNQNDTETFAPLVTDASQGMTTISQLINVADLQQISDYTRVPATSALQSCANDPDGIADNEIHIGVRSDNAETETPFSLYVQGALPAEYDPDIQQSLDPIVLVPGDLPEVLTVGAFDPRTNKMAWYSGRSNSLQYYELNNFNVDYSDDELVKPNLVTYGEILLPSGRKFFGTSAATPVVGGVAALWYERNDGIDVDQLVTTGYCLIDGAVGRQLHLLQIGQVASGQSRTACESYYWEADLSSGLISNFTPPETL
ncbi:MAG: S8 family serine peptidase, partial [Anaerolineae bacterium]|nr:S8 family serine peptidase [Anaerolineae bacterium]